VEEMSQRTKAFGFRKVTGSQLVINTKHSSDSRPRVSLFVSVGLIIVIFTDFKTVTTFAPILSVSPPASFILMFLNPYQKSNSSVSHDRMTDTLGLILPARPCFRILVELEHIYI
jgi:hypothetical protein